MAAYDRQMARQRASEKAKGRPDKAQTEQSEKNPEKVLANAEEPRYNALKRESENEPQTETTANQKETEGIAHGTDIREERGLLNLKIVYTYSLLTHCLQMPRRNQTIQKRSFCI